MYQQEKHFPLRKFTEESEACSFSTVRPQRTHRNYSSYHLHIYLEESMKSVTKEGQEIEKRLVLFWNVP